jgi:hypothetical protein
MGTATIEEELKTVFMEVMDYVDCAGVRISLIDDFCVIGKYDSVSAPRCKQTS